MQSLKNRIVFSFREILYLNGFRTTGDFKVIVKDTINQKLSVNKMSVVQRTHAPRSLYIPFSKNSGDSTDCFFFTEINSNSFFTEINSNSTMFGI